MMYRFQTKLYLYVIQNEELNSTRTQPEGICFFVCRSHQSFTRMKLRGCLTDAVYQRPLTRSLSGEGNPLGGKVMEYNMCLICQRHNDEDLSVGTADAASSNARSFK